MCVLNEVDNNNKQSIVKWKSQGKSSIYRMFIVNGTITNKSKQSSLQVKGSLQAC
jgi:hypothetical protein